MKKSGVFIHILIWGFLLTIPAILKATSDIRTSDIHIFYIHLIALLILFYVNYSFLIKKYFYTNRKVYIICILLIVTTLSFSTYMISETLIQKERQKELQGERTRPREFPANTFIYFVDKYSPHVLDIKIRIGTIFFYYLLFSLTSTIALIIRLILKEYNYEQEQTKMELKTLRMQLNPHFLFNTLNNIYSLINTSPEKAQKCIYMLTKILRYVLHDDDRSLRVPFYKEVEFVENYIELQKIRCGNHVEIVSEIDLDEIDLNKMVIPLLSVSLLENAFKYGVHPSKKSFIRFRLYRNGNTIVTTTENTIFDNLDTTEEHTGIGLKNLRKRLDILFFNAYALNLREENNMFITEMIVPLKR